jgi:alpha-aminoadipate carrier protein LysW
MALLCPECESAVVVDVDEAEEGDIVPCEDCGVELEIVSLSPLKVEPVDDTGYDDPEESLFPSGDEEDEE